MQLNLKKVNVWLKYFKGMFHVEQLSYKIKPAETVLKQFTEILYRWQKALNLVSENDLKDLWVRHILDSAQVYFYLPENAEILVDFGTGGGFPGLVLAILNKCLNGHLKDIYLLESDIKKSIFLQEVVRELDLSVHIINQRIEKVKDIKADVITARGFASVEKIIRYAVPFMKKNTILLLHKGENVHQEIQNIQHNFVINLIPSFIQNKGYIVQISEVQND